MIKRLQKLLTGEPVSRSPDAQAAVDARTKTMALYHYSTCAFSWRVRQVIDRLSLSIELRDIHQVPTHYEDLVRGGGRATVPCLRLDGVDGAVHWMYESTDIAGYLIEQFEGE